MHGELLLLLGFKTEWAAPGLLGNHHPYYFSGTNPGAAYGWSLIQKCGTNRRTHLLLNGYSQIALDTILTPTVSTQY